MCAVEPIKDLKKIEKMKKQFLKTSVRDYTMFVVGINIALRITDLLSLKWSDVMLKNGEFRDIKIKEGKTKKLRIIRLNDSCRKCLTEYKNTLASFNLTNYIFTSREGDGKQITRNRAIQVMKGAAEAVGITEDIGTHSLRKIWAYQAYRNGAPPATIMETLNHSSWKVTRIYASIGQDDINELYDSLNL